MAKSVFEGLNRKQANALANKMNQGFNKKPAKNGDDEKFVSGIKLVPAKKKKPAPKKGK